MASAAHLADRGYTPATPARAFAEPVFANRYVERAYASAQPKRIRVDTELAPGLMIETTLPPVAGLVEAIIRLHELKGLRAGWDSYDGSPVNERAFGPALELIVHSLTRCQAPQITPASSGGLILAWVADQRELEIEIEPVGTFGIYLSIDEQGQEYDPGLGRSREEAKEALNRFCRSA